MRLADIKIACRSCKGTTRVDCAGCWGHGRFNCGGCHGMAGAACTECDGLRFSYCDDCNGKCFVRCPTCYAARKAILAEAERLRFRDAGRTTPGPDALYIGFATASYRDGELRVAA